MDTIMLNPFRLDALFRAFRLCAERTLPEGAGTLDGFSTLFFSGARREGRPEPGLTKTERNCIKRLSSSQGRNFLRTLSDIRLFFLCDENEEILLANCGHLCRCMEEAGGDLSGFLSYVGRNLGSPYLSEDERSLWEEGFSPDRLLCRLFRYSFQHLDQVTGIAADSLYEYALTLYPGAETRLRVCEEIAPYNAGACAEYADWLNDEKEDKAGAVRLYLLHPESNLCVWQAANRLRQLTPQERLVFPSRIRRAVEKTAASRLASCRAAFTPEQCKELEDAVAVDGDSLLSSAYTLFFCLAFGHDPFSKAFSALAQMITSRQISFPGKEADRLAGSYYERGIASGDMTPVLNISNHLVSSLSNSYVRPIGSACPPLTPSQREQMIRYNRLALELGFRSSRFSALRIEVCDRLARGEEPDLSRHLEELMEFEQEDASLASGVSRVFVTRSDYWALRAEASADPAERIRCLEKALEIETAKGYDHIPQLVFHLCRISLRSGLVADPGRLRRLLEGSAPALCSDSRYADETKRLLEAFGF